jgi:hypothetical protein
MITNLNIGYYGRFGNQLFQFASTIGIGKKLGYDVKFPIQNITNSLTHNTADGKPFMAKLNITECFNIDNSLFSDNINPSFFKSERFFHFDDEMFKIEDNTSINGYFQSEKYFEHCKDEIIDTLEIKPEIIKIANQLIPKTDKELVSIHIRRTDYLVLGDYHSLNGVDYVNSAIELLGGENNYHFLICSDDTNWCQTIWGDNKNFTIINGESSYVDFTVMSLCHHHIISNSSFSWWSSYLSKNKNKKIIAPSNWFGPNMSSTILNDLYTKNMIII